MSEEFVNSIGSLSDKQLLEMLSKPEDYRPEAIAFATRELENRGDQARIETEVASERADTPTTVPPSSTSLRLGLKWFKFWTYISLPVGGIICALSAVAFPKVSSLLLLFAAMHFGTAYGMHHRKIWSWKLNWILLMISYLGYLIPEPITEELASTPVYMGFQVLLRLILGALIWLWPNYVYWKKRKVLFS